MLHWIIKCCLRGFIVSGVLRRTTNFILFIIYFLFHCESLSITSKNNLTKLLRNKLTVRLNNKIDTYNPVHQVCQLLANHYMLLSDNFDDIINGKGVSVWRKLGNYSNISMHLAILIKYAVLVKHDGSGTLAMFGESFHKLADVYYISRVCLSIQLIVVPFLLTFGYFGDQYITNALQSISRFDKTSPFNWINNRKQFFKLLLMTNLCKIILKIHKWVIFPIVLLYCSNSVYLDGSLKYNLVTLVISSIVQYMYLTNAISIPLCGAIAFYMTLSMVQFRFTQIF